MDGSGGGSMKVTSWEERLLLSNEQWDSVDCMLEEIIELRSRVSELEEELSALKRQEPIGFFCTNPYADFSYQVSLKPGYQNSVPLYPAAGAHPVPEGMVLVPVEPTEVMLKAGRECPVSDDGTEDCPEDYRSVYKAMLDAAK